MSICIAGRIGHWILLDKNRGNKFMKNFHKWTQRRTAAIEKAAIKQHNTFIGRIINEIAMIYAIIALWINYEAKEVVLLNYKDPNKFTKEQLLNIQEKVKRNYKEELGIK